MPVQDNEYSELRTSIIRLGRDLSPDDLQTLIEEYKPVINSPRRSSLIHSCRDLITVLEKRAFIDATYYSPLKKIVERLPSTKEKDNMLARLGEQSSRTFPLPQNNRYAPHQPENLFASMNAAPIQCTQRINYEFSNQPGILPEAVVDVISEAIGSKWREMARKLKLKEGDINRIKERHGKDFYRCSHDSLILFQSRCDRHDLQKNLLSALEKARRNDLRNQVQKMLNQGNY